ncbi:GntP family permease [Foetidibacter luteolus]|uniref:GntP family permease n=1 Tax=Foetidibacter luteolus TaxID=2608880 RepID=UPI00129B2A60|nr:GntP family permease [Foetidibacter luteolus]
MHISLTHLLIALIAGIASIVLLTARYKVHAFFALFIACFVVGLSVQMPVDAILKAMKEGFGHIMSSLALIIVLGATLGVLLEHTGSTKVMADYILRKTGERRAPLAMSITGFVVGLPIFCDSGYIVLSGLAKSLARRTGTAITIIAVSLATGLYSVHCLIPPHPGMSAAAAALHIDYGRLILTGILVAIPASMAGYAWAVYAGKKMADAEVAETSGDMATQHLKPIQAFLPVFVPIVLIALNSFLSGNNSGAGVLSGILNVMGEPVIALSAGIVLALFNARKGAGSFTHVLQEAAEKAGGILVIIGAGGAFGAVLAATNPAGHFAGMAIGGKLALLFPFLVTFVLKTAQGSSTVAIITASSLVQPLLPALGLDSENGRLLAVLGMGAGSMMISHANDAYFWVIAKFSGFEMKAMLKVYSVASVWMGLVTLGVIYLLSFFML